MRRPGVPVEGIGRIERVLEFAVELVEGDEVGD